MLQTTDERIDLAAAGDAISGVLGQSSLDLRKKLVDASGILWHSLDEATATRMAQALQRVGIPATTRAHRSLRKTGERYEVTRAVFKPEGFEVALPKENRLVPYENIVLMNCAKVKGEFTTKKDVASKSSTGMDHSYHLHGGRFRDIQPMYHTYQEREQSKTYLDIFVTKPDNIIRFESQTVKYPGLGIPMAYSSMENFRRLVEALTRKCPQALCNVGVDVLLGRGGSWSDAHFDSHKEFDRHNLWMMQLMK